MTIETQAFDPAAYLDSPDAMLAYLNGALRIVTPAQVPMRWAWSPAHAACPSSPRKPA